MKLKQAIHRFLVLVLAVSLMIQFAVPMASAVGTTRITFGQVSGRCGDTVTVPVTITNNPGIASFRFRVSYDTTALTFVSAEVGSLTAHGTLKAAYQSDDQELAITWFAVENAVGDGVVMNLKFIVTDTAFGDYALTPRFLAEDIVNDTWQQVPCQVDGGKISSDKRVDSLSIAVLPRKVQYLLGEELDTQGMIVKARYHTGEDSAITGYTVSGYNAEQLGQQTITVSFAGKTATFQIEVKSRVPDVITSAVYTVKFGYIRKIPLGTTVETLRNGIDQKDFIRVFSNGIEVFGDAVIQTGMEVKLMDGINTKDTVIAVVTGDVNGDGKLSVTDMLAVKSLLLNKETLDEVYAVAADVTGDGKQTITDFIQIKAHLLGLGHIEAN